MWKFNSVACLCALVRVQVLVNSGRSSGLVYAYVRSCFEKFEEKHKAFNERVGVKVEGW